MNVAAVPAKINLSLVVGESRPDGLHRLATLMQRIDIVDRLTVELAGETAVTGFANDTLITRALAAVAEASGVPAGFRATVEKRIPVAAGLGGGSADAAAALVLANRLLGRPLPHARLHELAFALGSDVPFFLAPGPKLVGGAGELVEPVTVPQDYAVVVALPHDVAKRSTGEVYARFDELGGGARFDERAVELRSAIAACEHARDLARLPPNDLAEASGARAAAARLAELGAFRADVNGAGPSAYGLFARRRDAEQASSALRSSARTWVTVPVW